MSSISSGRLDREIVFERAAITRDSMNAQVKTWETYATARASVSFGTGQERRQAAQEGGSAPATFRTRWRPDLAGVRISDRINFMDAAWDITSIAPWGRNVALDFTAVRAA